MGNESKQKLIDMFNTEKAIKKWLKSFNKHRAFDEGRIQEMELHLRDHLDDLKSEGLSDQAAFEQAIKEFGDVDHMADEEFSTIKRKTSIRSILYTQLFRNYCKTSFRGMLRSPMNSFINVFGLAVAIGICLVVYSFLDFDYNIDAFHKNKEDVYLATFFVDREGQEEQYGLTPTPLAEMLKEDFSNIKGVCRIKDRNVVIKQADNVFHESISFVDPEYLSMLTFPLEQGTSNSLKDLNSIILSKDMAIKYFGKENPIGKDMLVKFDGKNSKTFMVSGVAEQFPAARAISFNFLINFNNFKISDPSYDFHDWTTNVNGTLIHLKQPADIEIIKQGMLKYKTIQNSVEKDWAISAFALHKLADLHFESGNIKNDISHDNLDEGRKVLPILAVLMLLLACLNYVNIAIVSAAKRLKEIGLRKVIGANRRLLIVQFLTENVFVTLFAMVLGLVLAYFIFLPWFAQLSSIDLKLTIFSIDLWVFLIATVLVTGIVSGIYPAFYVSKFDVINIFKGSVKFGKKNTLTKVFLGMQLILACIGITGAVMFTQNSAFQAGRSWGYNQKEALYVEVPDESSYLQLAGKMMTNPGVLSLAGSNHHLGRAIESTVLHRPERDYEVSQLSVGPNYFETMGLKLQNGRFFTSDLESDKQKVIVNELLVKNLSLTKSLGETFKIDTTRYEIVGVVKDFFFYNFYSENKPTIFKVADENSFKYLSIKMKEGKEQEVYKSLQTNWTALFPETPFKGGYQEDVWGSFYEELVIMKKFMRTVAYIGVLLAGLGLYGLISFNVSGRVREFSIRKVLGANTSNIAMNIIKQYLILAIIALIIGAPISYSLIKANIEMMFPTPMPMGISGVAIAVTILISVLLLVIFIQVRKVYKANPVDGLKVE